MSQTDYQLVGEAPWASSKDISDAFEFWRAHAAVKSAAGRALKVARFRVVNAQDYDYLTHLEPGGIGYPKFGGLADDREDAIDFLAWSFEWDDDDAEWLYDSYADNPIVVFVHGDQHMLADGFHRMEVAYGMGDPTMSATLLVAEEANPKKGSSYPKRSRDVTAYLKQHGYEGYELVKGRGYFYFDGPDTAAWPATSVYTYRLGHLTLDQWLAEFEELKGEYDRWH
jgi:hypothetical protein